MKMNKNELKSLIKEAIKKEMKKNGMLFEGEDTAFGGIGVEGAGAKIMGIAMKIAKLSKEIDECDTYFHSDMPKLCDNLQEDVKNITATLSRMQRFIDMTSSYNTNYQGKREAEIDDWNKKHPGHEINKDAYLNYKEKESWTPDEIHDLKARDRKMIEHDDDSDSEQDVDFQLDDSDMDSLKDLKL